MADPTHVIARAPRMPLGSADASLRFGDSRDRPAGSGPGARQLHLDGEAAFELSFWCGTCPLVFERLNGANRTLSNDALQGQLNAGTTMIPMNVLDAISVVIPEAEYVPMLLSVRPELAMPAGRNDYFAQEQVAHRGVNVFWGLPENPHTPYYRAGRREMFTNDFLFEFVVPMVPPSWNEADRVAQYERELRDGASPTILALSIIDRTQPHDSYVSHTGLINFVLDGHHKLEAAARLGLEVTILSVLSVDDSLATPEEINEVLDFMGAGTGVL